MASTLVSYGLRLAATFPSNQARGGETVTIHTDTETQPTNLYSSYTYHEPVNPTRDNRNVSVQTKVFRTDLPADNGNTNFSACYIIVNKRTQLNGT